MDPVLIYGMSVEEEDPQIVGLGNLGHIVPPFTEYQEFYSALQETERPLWGPASGHSIVLYGIVVSAVAALTFQIDIVNPDTTVYRSIRLHVPANGGANPLMYFGGWKLPQGARIRYSTSAATTNYCAVFGREE